MYIYLFTTQRFSAPSPPARSRASWPSPGSPDQLYFTILYYTILYSIIIYYTILYYTILYYNMYIGIYQACYYCSFLASILKIIDDDI